MTVGRRPSRTPSRSVLGSASSTATNNTAAPSNLPPPYATSSTSTPPTEPYFSPIPEASASASGADDAYHHHNDSMPSSGCDHHQSNTDHHRASAASSATGSAGYANTNGQSEADSDREATYEELKFAQPPPPKHIPFPDVPQPSEVMCELVMFVYTMIAAATQFLHLYRSVWWLPDSNSTQAVVSAAVQRGCLRSVKDFIGLQNFYLIDSYLVVFVLALLSRRFLYCVLSRIIQCLCPRLFLRYVLTAFRIVFFVAILIFLGVCCESIFQRQGYNVIYICYPLIVYFITFGLRFEPFLRTTFECPKAPYLNGAPLHCCSTNPETVRAEIESLRSDYNNRFKQVVFTTILNAYYAAFIPCCFAPSFLYYDIYWATQHMAFMIVGGFTMCTALCFPANYCDVMHRAALHLGQWNRMEPSKFVIPARFWSRRVAWPGSMVVRYHGELFKATGLTTMAVPGCAVHYRFFAFFKNPAHLYLILASVQLSVCALQLIILYFVVEWHNVISLGFLMLANYYTLYRIGRDFAITQKVYAAEGSIYDKISTAMDAQSAAAAAAAAATAGENGGMADASAADDSVFAD